MPITGTTTARAVAARTRKALTAVLPLGVAVDLRPRRGQRPGFDAIVQTGKTRHRAIVGWAGEGWPADVERLVEQTSDIQIAVARDLSIGARDWLSARNVGWVDEVGRANVSLASGLVVVREITDPPRPMATERWTRSSISVAETVLNGTEPTVTAIEHATGLSRGATANALALFERLRYLQREARHGPGSGRRVANLDALLDDYANAVAVENEKTSPLLLHRLWRDPLDALVDELAPALDRLDATWAATGAAAATLLAPYLTTFTIVELYVDGTTLSKRAVVSAALNAKPVASGHRIELRALPNRVTATGPSVRGVRCALPARVYADLRAKGGRSAEAAQHLREVLGAGTDA